MRDRHAFLARCLQRDKERLSGSAYGLGLFVGETLVGEVNLNNVMRGALQSATIGYWVDQAHAGNAYVAEGVVVLARFAFEELDLHRLEICIVPRNARSRRVMEKLAIREEGLALRYLEINGAWEDHVRYGFTIEEWIERRDELGRAWLDG
jgi:ribosomal-protein-alanine N-acetyltransferase